MDFSNFANVIIDNIEGGYYHPDMKAKLKNGENMGDSGETLFGMDRKYGIGTSTAEGAVFWGIIDNILGDHHGDTKFYNYKPGGATGEKLRNLAGQMMKSLYDKYTTNLLSLHARQLVNKSAKLAFHFYYACYNGYNAFKYYATQINNAVAGGITDEADLLDIAYNSRKNYLSQTADKVKKCWGLINTDGGWFWWLLAAVAGVGIYFASKK